MDKGDLELAILLSPSPEYWDSRGMPPGPVYLMLELKLGNLCVLGKYSESHPHF